MFSNELVCNIIEYINKNINKEITIDELSSIFYFDKTYIMKRFKRELNLSIHEYINDMRILNSLSLYEYDNYILSISLNNGFNSIEYYSETFKKIIGVSPIIYKRFINRNPSVKYKDIDTILMSVNNLSNIKNKINRYLSNRKPKTTTKTLIMNKKL